MCRLMPQRAAGSCHPVDSPRPWSRPARRWHAICKHRFAPEEVRPKEPQRRMALKMTPAPGETAAQQEQCPACLQLYRYELEYRCVLCDEPLCPLCVMRVRETWACPGCAEEI